MFHAYLIILAANVDICIMSPPKYTALPNRFGAVLNSGSSASSSAYKSLLLRRQVSDIYESRDMHRMSKHRNTTVKFKDIGPGRFDNVSDARTL
jgi:hypothetical protein